MPTRWFLLVLLAAVVAAGFAVARRPPPAPISVAPGSGTSMPISGGFRFVDLTGQPAPDFSLTDLQGRRHSLSAQRGRVVMLVFWATWCKSCPQELPGLSALARVLAPKGLVTLSIDGEKDPAPVARMARSLSFPVLRDPGDRTRHSYDAFAVPRVVIVNRAGRIARVIRGYQGETTPVVTALAEQGFRVPALSNGARLVPVERVPGG